MKTIISTLLMGAAFLLATGTPTRADNACLQDARSAFMDCKASCKSDYQDARAGCRGVDPGCFGACIDARETCTTNATASLDACLVQNDCAGVVDKGRATCKVQVGCGAPQDPCGFNPDYVHCLDPYEQLGFTCRDNCRNLWQVGGGPVAVKACESQFHDCVKACPMQ
jgi:hypothetical protein